MLNMDRKDDKNIPEDDANFAQIIVGPPGAGKTSYCHGMGQFLRLLGRNLIVVNLDPANDSLPYEVSVDIRELVKVETVMDQFQLGPNAAILYCIEYLEQNFIWLKDHIEASSSTKPMYILFDCPGQVELYTHHTSMKHIFEKFNQLNYHLTCVQLVDFHHCIDPFKYLSAIFMSLTTMLQLELPHVNVLSKIDLMKSLESLPFKLEFYTEVQDLDTLLAYLEDEGDYFAGNSEFSDVIARQRIFAKKTRGISKALVGLIQDFGLVNYVPLAIEDGNNLLLLIKLIDQANGYVPSNENEKDTLDRVSLMGDRAPISHLPVLAQEKYAMGDDSNVN